MFGVKNKNRKHQGKLRISSPPFRDGKCQLTTGVPMLAWHSSQCAARHACRTCIHSSGYFVMSLDYFIAFAPNPSFASYNPFKVTSFKLKTSCWRKGCCFNKWMTHFTYPAVTWSLRDKNPKDSRHQNNTERTGYEFYEGGDPKKTCSPVDSFLLADWNGSNGKNNEGFLFMFTMFLDTFPRISSPCQDCPIWTEPFPESMFRKKWQSSLATIKQWLVGH